MNWFTTETGGCGECSPHLRRWRDVRIPFIYVRELAQGKQVPQEKQPTHNWNVGPRCQRQKLHSTVIGMIVIDP